MARAPRHPTRAIADVLEGANVEKVAWLADSIMGSLMADGWINEDEIRDMEPYKDPPSTAREATDG